MIKFCLIWALSENNLEYFLILGKNTVYEVVIVI